jgi:hypothetical protein
MRREQNVQPALEMVRASSRHGRAVGLGGDEHVSVERRPPPTPIS